MLFQGEEWAEEAPFDYFTSHGDAGLVEAVRKGRHEEYLHLLDDGADIGSWADPQAEETFRRCKLRWDSIDRAPHADMLAFYRALIALRRALTPLRNGRKDLTRVEGDEAGRWLTIRRGDPWGAATFTCASLGDAPARISLPEGRWRLALATDRLAAPDGAALLLPPSTAAIYELVT
jgi:maltooligosyltrehalose trehalohydrolase